MIGIGTTSRSFLVDLQLETVSFDSPSVPSYLTILQTVIGRMATNSASCKTWCVSLTSAIVVIIADEGKPSYVWFAAIPIVLFLLLDAYYLALERHFRSVYNGFIRKLHSGKATVEDIFFVAPRSGVAAATSREIAKAGGSISVWPFYTLLALMSVVVRAWIL